MSSSKPVKDALAAMVIARDAALKGGVTFSIVSSTKKVNGSWIVELWSFLGTYLVKINASNGEVLEFKSVK